MKETAMDQHTCGTFAKIYISVYSATMNFSLLILVVDENLADFARLVNPLAGYIIVFSVFRFD